MWFGVVWCGVVWRGVAWRGVAWGGEVQRKRVLWGGAQFGAKGAFSSLFSLLTSTYLTFDTAFFCSAAFSSYGKQMACGRTGWHLAGVGWGLTFSFVTTLVMRSTTAPNSSLFDGPPPPRARVLLLPPPPGR